MKKFVILLSLSLALCSLTSCSEETITTDSTVVENIVANDMEGAIGGSVPDTEFTSSFYMLSGKLSNIIDTDKLPDWEEAVKSVEIPKGEDPFIYENIYEFIRFFDVSRDAFEDLYYSTNLYYLYDYDFDLLYGNDKEKVYAYYRTEQDDFLKRNTESYIKKDIREYVGSEKFYQWLIDSKEEAYGDHYDTSWGIAEAIFAFDIPRNVIEEIIDNYISSGDILPIVEVYEDGMEEVIAGDGYRMFEYNLDMVYENNAEILEAIAAGVPGYQLDEMLRW